MHKNLPNFFIFIDKHNSTIFQNNITNIGVIYRNYNDLNREKELIKVAKECKKKRYQLFVSNDIKLAIKVKANGIYLPSFNKTKRLRNLENKNLTILGSAHNQKEIYQKILQKCEGIFVSPIFPIKKSQNHLYLHKFNFLSLACKANVLALGGIDTYNINKLKLLNISGFGGIRIAKKKTGLKKAGFFKELNLLNI